MPKSMISAWSSASIMMLAGFRSRWTTPALCAATSPERYRARDAQHRRRPAACPRASRMRREIGALDVRHRDVLDAVDLAEVVNADDVLVRDLAREQQLALEAALDFRGRRRIRHHLGPNHLDRDRDAELRVPRLIDRAHAADAEQPDDVIARAKRLTNFERAGVRLTSRGDVSPSPGARVPGGVRSLVEAGSSSPSLVNEFWSDDPPTPPLPTPVGGDSRSPSRVASSSEDTRARWAGCCASRPGGGKNTVAVSGPGVSAAVAMPQSAPNCTPGIAKRRDLRQCRTEGSAFRLLGNAEPDYAANGSAPKVN